MNLRETAIVSGGLLAQQVTVFATGVLIARYLGAADYGILGILKSLSSLLLIVTPLGLDLALLKHASFYHERPAELQTTSRALRLLVASCNMLLLALLLLGLGTQLQRIYPDVPHFATLCAITTGRPGLRPPTSRSQAPSTGFSTAWCSTPSWSTTPSLSYASWHPSPCWQQAAAFLASSMSTARCSCSHPC